MVGWLNECKEQHVAEIGQFDHFDLNHLVSKLVTVLLSKPYGYIICQWINECFIAPFMSPRA